MDSLKWMKELRRCSMVESLEDRRLLSVDSFYGPPDYDTYLARQMENSAVCTEGFIDNEIDSLMKAVSNSVSRINDGIILNADSEVNESVIDGSNCENDPFFEEYGFYIDGKKYVLLSDLQFLDAANEALSLNELDYNQQERGENDLRDDIEEWDLELTVSCSDSCQSSQTPQNGVYQLHEGHNSTLSFPGSLADPVSSDFMTVTLPALPLGYYSTITFGGTATYGSDYYVCVPYGGGSASISSGYLHSGSSEELYIMLVDDRLTESDETFSLTMGTPVAESGYQVEPYVFNEVNTTVSSVIIDNDGWTIGVVSENGVVSGETIISETNSGQVNVHVSRLDDGSNHGSDLHYLINATVAVSGTASPSDYKIYLNNANGTNSLITPDSSGRFTVTIPENEQYATLTIKAQDDSIVERLEETLTLTVVEAKGYPPFISYSTDDDSFVIKIRDNDKLSLSTVQFKNNLNLVSDTTESFGTSWQNVLHWIANYPSQTLPVAYASNETMACYAAVQGNIDNSQTYQIRMKWSYSSVNASGSIYSEWQTISDMSHTEISLGASFINIFGIQQAYYDLESTLEWEFRTTSEVSRENDGNMGNSVNPLYVTYKAPSNVSCDYYHSLIHIGCVAASAVVSSGNSSNMDDQVFQALWNKIASKSITKVKLELGSVVNDELLTYYGRYYDNTANLNVSEITVKDNLEAMYYPASELYVFTQIPTLARQISLATNQDRYGNGFNVTSLLYYKDGTCGAWQDFVFNLCGIQGLTCERVGVWVDDNDDCSKAFMINRYLTGQGNVIPGENIWGDHALIKYAGNVYDPSYGATYGSYNTFLTAFISNVDSKGSITRDRECANGRDYGFLYSPESYFVSESYFRYGTY